MQAQDLVTQLSSYVDSFLGDSLAGLPDQDRSSRPFCSLVSSIKSFAAAVLKFKLQSPAEVKLLRRLLAALLPEADSGMKIAPKSGAVQVKPVS